MRSKLKFLTDAMVMISDNSRVLALFWRTDRRLSISSPVSSNLSANYLVTKVESEPLLRRVLALTERVPFDKYIGNTCLLFSICYSSHLCLPAIHHDVNYDVFSITVNTVQKNLSCNIFEGCPFERQLKHVFLNDK